MGERKQTAVTHARGGYLLVITLLLCAIVIAAGCGKADDKYGRPTDTYPTPMVEESSQTQTDSEESATEEETTEEETTQRPTTTRPRPTETSTTTQEAVPVDGTQPDETQSEEPASSDTQPEPTQTDTDVNVPPRFHWPWESTTDAQNQ